MKNPTGEKTAGPLHHAVPPTPASPLSAYLPLQAPSMNSLLTMYCVGGKPKLEMKAEVRLFRMQMKSKLPKWQYRQGSFLTLTLRFHQTWHYANGKPKHQDVPNLVKCCLDCLAERYGFDDSYIWQLTCEKVESTQVGIEIELGEYLLPTMADEHPVSCR